MVSSSSASSSPLDVWRGGAVETAASDEQQEEEDAVQELYLPGLLDTIVVKSRTVRYLLVYL